MKIVAGAEQRLTVKARRGGRLQLELKLAEEDLEDAEAQIEDLSSDVESLAVNMDELEWSPPGGGNGFPVGVRTATQGYDPISEGRTYYAMFPAGSHRV